MPPDDSLRPPRTPFGPAFWILVVVGLTASMLADPWVWRHVHIPGDPNKDFWWMLRNFGYIYLWVIVGAAFVLIDSGPNAGVGTDRRSRGEPTHGAGGEETASLRSWRRVARRGLGLVLAAALSGAAAEIMKLVVRRERPSGGDFEYVFRPFLDQPFSTKALGLPSSHAATAFGAAFMLCKLHPRGWPIWIAGAAASSYQRVAAGAHYLSDAVLAAVVAYVVVELGWHLGWKSFGLRNLHAAD